MEKEGKYLYTREGVTGGAIGRYGEYNNGNTVIYDQRQKILFTATELVGGDIMADFIQFIQTVGFPIAICVYLLYDRAKSDQLHKEEMDSMKEALNNNTNALTRILEVLHVGSSESN